MKKPSKKKIILIVLSIILGFSILISTSSYYHQDINSGHIKKDNERSLKRAGFWNIGPIEIDDDDPTKNWLITKATYDWCNGSGTLTDPYVIENVTIDGQNSDYCIEIRDSDLFFIIKNYTLYNADYYGIILRSTTNGRLIKNNCFNNGKYGIIVSHSDNNYILNNTANNHQYFSMYGGGIYIEYRNDNEIIGNIANNNDNGIYMEGNNNNNEIQNNTANNNGVSGIRFYGQNNYNKILENIINDNGEYGIYLHAHYENCDYNEISGNTANNNGYHGIYLYHDYSTLGSCSSNDIIGNIINNNTQNGIKLQGWTDNNEISGNNLINSTLYGVLLESNSDSNTIYNNTFLGNTINALDSGTGNQWDYSTLGNYWDDYGGVDANDDGIGDTPYDVPPVGGSIDNYPIWDDGDDLVPSIIINSPSMNDAFGLIAPDFDITINDDSPINTTWYTIDGGITNYNFSGLTGTVNQTGWDNKGTELMTLRFYANDSLGHLGFKDVLIWKDLVAPQITINSPTPNQLCGVDAPTFSLTIVEPNVQIKRYSINGRPNITFTTQTQFSQPEWDNIGNGTVLITFYAIDKVGNVNSSEVIVRKDAYIPDIIIHSPIQDEVFRNTPPEFNISIIEEDLVSTWYTIENIAGIFPFSELTGSIDQDAWIDVPEGEITITFYALDGAGNLGTESVTVMKRIPTTPAPAIPGYNLFFLLGTISVVTILISKKIKKS